VNEITCSVNVRIDPDAGFGPVLAAVAGYRDAGVDLIIMNLPHHASPDSLQPLAEALATLT
jgi:predicted Zn-dependent protease